MIHGNIKVKVFSFSFITLLEFSRYGRHPFFQPPKGNFYFHGFWGILIGHGYPFSELPKKTDILLPP